MVQQKKGVDELEVDSAEGPADLEARPFEHRRGVYHGDRAAVGHLLVVHGVDTGKGRQIVDLDGWHSGTSS